MAEKPSACSDCKTVFEPGQACYGSPDNDTVLCQACAEAGLPKCDACGKPATGEIGKIGDKVFHTACMKCGICKEVIEGKVSQIGKSFVCAACTAYLHDEAEKARKLAANGDEQGSIEIAKQLADKGYDLPAELFAPPAVEESGEGQSGPGNCCMCSKPISGSYSKLGDSTVCSDCGVDVRKKMEEAEGLAAKGDVEGASNIARALEAKGLKIAQEAESLGDNTKEPPLTCSKCSGQITGKYVKRFESVLCPDCAESTQKEMKSELEEFSKAMNSGDAVKAAELAETLTAKGVDLPDNMKEALASLQAAPKCDICSFALQGKCAKMADNVTVCEKCYKPIEAQILEAQGLVAKGDTVGAAAIARSLKEKGVPIPDILAEVGNESAPDAPVPKAGTEQPLSSVAGSGVNAAKALSKSKASAPAGKAKAKASPRAASPPPSKASAKASARAASPPPGKASAKSKAAGPPMTTSGAQPSQEQEVQSGERVSLEVRYMSGEAVICSDFALSDYVLTVKERILADRQVEVWQQNLTFQSEVLKDRSKLQELKLPSEGAVLEMMVRAGPTEEEITIFRAAAATAQEASTAVGEIHKRDIAEVFSMMRPPPACEAVVMAAAELLAGRMKVIAVTKDGSLKEANWKTCTLMLKDPGFMAGLSSLTTLIAESALSEDRIEACRKHLEGLEGGSEAGKLQTVNRCSLMASRLCKFLMCVLAYHDTTAEFRARFHGVPISELLKGR